MKFPVVIVCLFLLINPAYGADYNINLEWFKNFNDDILMEYILEAVQNNHDVKIAKNNILKYRQEKNLNISSEFPYASVGADYILLKVPKLAIPNNDLQTNSFALPFMTIWELDYLGKKYDEIRKSRLDIENSIFNLKAARLIVVTDLAQAYFNVSNLNYQIEIYEKILDFYNEIYKRKQKMFELGVISTNELNNSKDIVIYQKNLVSNLKKQKETFLTQIAILTGKSPLCINEIKISNFEKINYTGKIPNNLSGDIILNRPDILKLNNEIKKAKIDITIAKKEFLPSINIFGILAFSTIVQNFNWQGALAALSAGANQTLFDGGKRIFKFKLKKIEYETLCEEYLKADIQALKEVNDALYNLKKDIEIYKNDKERYEIANSNFINVFKSYKNGVRNYINYMDENILLFEKNINLTNSKNQNFSDLLGLYKAVGGVLE